ncbi:MAG: NeuD/PglB/VioB family sugar acetyltransferase [Holosporales bacterium]|jgi:sugar O-acyltransferase (sialic acid O-acetyltransferase NeuD family)|nr:NeuD/PglB/VioB family sugar acetyltransferase [Holosporales bacterium]
MTEINNFKQKLFCWGGGDQAICMLPILAKMGIKYDVVVDEIKDQVDFNCSLFLKSKDDFIHWAKNRDFSNWSFIIAIGNPYGFVRCEIHDWLKSIGMSPVTICSESAYLEKDVILGEGCQIMNKALLSTKAVIGDQCILNTNCLVEHHCNLSSGVEIGPSATLCGRVIIERYSWVGAGATVLPRLNIGANSIIGAGSTLCKSAEDASVYAGVPAKFLKENQFRPVS